MHRAILGAEQRGFFLESRFEHFLSLLFGRGPLAGLLLRGDELGAQRADLGVAAADELLAFRQLLLQSANFRTKVSLQFAQC